MPLFRRAPHDDSSGRSIVVGLGNPGAEYESTRHNAGARVIDLLLERAGGSLKRHKSGCLVAEVSIGGERAVLARPISYMNESGGPVGRLVRWYKTVPADLVVVHDEIDIPFGEVRIKAGGGTAGHNGLGSLVSHLGTKDFLRIRVGVGRPRGRGGAAGHVLDTFSGAERKELPDLLARAAEAVERVIEVGAERAMNEVNTRD
ncbi:MAG TPA: aminoacyl-tRNA hydrolase [Actinomycetota bacterium]|jgi:PTH1 family peptidyl-tRNA hydrolase